MRRVLLLFFIPVVWTYGFAVSLTLSADRLSVQAGGDLTVELTVEQDSGDSVEEINEPDFEHFEIANRAESSSSSFSMTNGRISSKKTQQITFILTPLKDGSFKIGPATARLASGKKITSNTINVLVTGTNGARAPQQGAKMETGQASEPARSDLEAPLSVWERQTPNCFVRVIVSPSEHILTGEPVTVSYYLFMRQNQISNIQVTTFPDFEASWKEELAAPSRLNLRRILVGGVVYDYALLRSYLVIPDPGVRTLTSTQMILEGTTGSFFSMKKKTVSSIALSIPLEPVPVEKDKDVETIGDFTLTQNTRAIKLGQEKLLDTLTYTFEGCGNLQALSLDLPEIRGLKLFSPDIKTDGAIRGTSWCGTKTITFMVKGMDKGEYTIPSVSIGLYDRSKGYYTLKTDPVTVTVSQVSAAGSEEKIQKSSRFEWLKQLPPGLTVYSLTPLMDRAWFIITLIIPFAALFVAFIIWLIRLFIKGRREKTSYIRKIWEEKMISSSDISSLLNNFYDGCAEVCGLQIRGLRMKDIPRGLEKAADFIAKAEYALYAGAAGDSLEELKKQAVAVFREMRVS